MPSHFIFPCSSPPLYSSTSLQLSSPLVGLPLHVCWAEGQARLATGSRLVTALKWKLDQTKTVGWFPYDGCTSPVPKSLGCFYRGFAAKLYKDFNKNFLSLEKEVCLCCQRARGKWAMQPSWSTGINPMTRSLYFQTDQLLMAVTNLSPFSCCAGLYFQTWQLTYPSNLIELQLQISSGLLPPFIEVIQMSC